MGGGVDAFFARPGHPGVASPAWLQRCERHHHGIRAGAAARRTVADRRADSDGAHDKLPDPAIPAWPQRLSRRRTDGEHYKRTINLIHSRRRTDGAHDENMIDSSTLRLTASAARPPPCETPSPCHVSPHIACQGLCRHRHRLQRTLAFTAAATPATACTVTPSQRPRRGAGPRPGPGIAGWPASGVLGVHSRMYTHVHSATYRSTTSNWHTTNSPCLG
jgi:hypothetical protein